MRLSNETYNSFGVELWIEITGLNYGLISWNEFMKLRYRVAILRKIIIILIHTDTN